MSQLIECVPNFSNGRNPEIYHAIADAIRAVPGARLLDVSPDADHNRTVITFVGGPTAVLEAAFQAIKLAAQLINLDEHQGEHPRIGATDVCPLIPLRGISTQECVALAQRLGQRVGNELGIAVYLYGAAATRPEREKLADIRKGQYEAWKEEIGINPARQPDYGPAEAKPWGATVIGVRPFLIAYNIYLNSSDADVAEKIARAVRFSSGGLRFVQAKGFLVEGQAQVSMNLTDFEKTPIYRVQEMVRREAARYGLSITKAELVGLTPQKAFIDAARWYLQLDDFREEQVLEYRLYDESASDNTPEPFLEAVAANKPTPGGGSVAALAGALGAALAQMVAGLTAGRKKYAEIEEEMQAALTQAVALRRQLTAAIADDAAAFEQVMTAMRQKELSQADKQAAIEQATIHAGEVPLRVARLSLEAAQVALRMAQVGNVNAVSDAAAGVLMARAAVEAAALNVQINGAGLQNQQLAQSWASEVKTLVAQAQELATQATAVAAARGGF